MDFNLWITFLAATVAISLSPGPGAIAAMGAGLSHGFRRGQPIAFGLLLGVWTQVIVVGAGLGLLLSSSELAFSLLKWAGAAYLVWLGIQQWRSPVSSLAAPQAAADEAPPKRRSLVLRGWGVNALNPKGTVFLLAVLPQFTTVSEPLLPQYAVICATFGLVECCVMSGYVALASRVQGLLRSPRQVRWMNRGFGSLLVVAGVVLGSFRRSA